MAELLRQRFEALMNPVDDSDWLEVRRRAGETKRRRPVWIALAAAIAAVTVLLTTPALGLRGRIVQLFQESEPAPRSVVVDFASIDVGAPPGMAPGVLSEEARRVADFKLSTGRTITLWVAPTRAGGFCMVWQESTGGCLPARGPRISPSIIDAPPVRIEGSVRAEPGAALQLEFQDGEVLGLPLVWVSPPIDAGFFLYEVPPHRREDGRLPLALVLREADGGAVARRRLPVMLEYPPLG